MPDPDEWLLAAEDRRRLNHLLQPLPRRTREILALRWGLVDGRRWTLEEIGRRYRLSRERVRQIVEEARRQLLRRLRTPEPTPTAEPD